MLTFPHSYSRKTATGRKKLCAAEPGHSSGRFLQSQWGKGREGKGGEGKGGEREREREGSRLPLGRLGLGPAAARLGPARLGSAPLGSHAAPPPPHRAAMAG